MNLNKLSAADRAAINKLIAEATGQHGTPSSASVIASTVYPDFCGDDAQAVRALEAWVAQGKKSHIRWRYVIKNSPVIDDSGYSLEKDEYAILVDIAFVRGDRDDVNLHTTVAGCGESIAAALVDALVEQCTTGYETCDYLPDARRCTKELCARFHWRLKPALKATLKETK